ncbi:hypothetical protein JTB14_003144 [Gonioctena quinquepunctata]|nr:hypothetical protein JTB14_003144 [Gonioctena quinquepunctata]
MENDAEVQFYRHQSYGTGRHLEFYYAAVSGSTNQLRVSPGTSDGSRILYLQQGIPWEVPCFNFLYLARHEPTWYQDYYSLRVIALPSTRNCAGDKLSISLSGNENFQDARNYCGNGSVTLVTEANALAVGLFATVSSSGGRFICTLTAIRDPDVTTTAAPNVCDCGWKQTTRIVGGQETLVNEFPSMAGLVDSSTKNVFCGATIISTRYVLTAAHCLLNVQQVNLGVLVGDHNISSGYDTTAAALYKVSAFEKHPNFKPNTLISSWDFLGQTVTALGWGQIFYTGPPSEVLQKVDLTVTSNSICAKENSNSVITADNICTYAPNKDACQSDSGGPLLWMDTSRRRLQLVGIISYGLGCASDLPGINTRVTSYISWIVSRTTDANYCIK